VPAKSIPTLDVRTRAAWRAWLKKHHRSATEIWLVFHKQHTGEPSIEYEDAVEEALCFGWIDSLIRRLDDARYARKFTPRKPDSRWSAINRRRYEKVQAKGLLTAAGRALAPTHRVAVAPSKRPWNKLPAYIEKGFRSDARAWTHFEQLAPSYRRAFIGWIDSAKREETKERRLREAVATLAAGRTLGLK
jgi:uncharacterized protein YdeI (YjbR/CyaY-like superfamily)